MIRKKDILNPLLLVCVTGGGIYTSSNEIYADNQFTNNPVEINVEAEDSESGIRVLEFPDGTRQFYGQETQGLSNVQTNYSVIDNGDYTFYAEDVATNKSSSTESIQMIDNEPPLIEVSNNPREWTNESVTLEAFFDGGWSGLAGIELPNGEYIGVQNLIPQNKELWNQGHINASSGMTDIEAGITREPDDFYPRRVHTNFLPLNDADYFTAILHDDYRMQVYWYEGDTTDTYLGEGLRYLHLTNGDTVPIPENANYMRITLGHNEWNEAEPFGPEVVDIVRPVFNPSNSRQFFDVEDWKENNYHKNNGVQVVPIDEAKPNTHYVIKTTMDEGVVSNFPYSAFLTTFGEPASSSVNGFSKNGPIGRTVESDNEGRLEVGFRNGGDGAGYINGYNQVMNDRDTVFVYESPVIDYTVDENGSYRFRAWDMAGNVAEHTEYVTMIDKANPSEGRIKIGENHSRYGENMFPPIDEIDEFSLHGRYSSSSSEEVFYIGGANGIPQGSGEFLEDERFGRVARFVSSGNPSAVPETTIRTGVSGFHYRNRIENELPLQAGRLYEMSAYVRTDSEEEILYLAFDGYNIDNAVSFRIDNEWQLLRFRNISDGTNRRPRFYLSGVDDMDGANFYVAEPKIREVLR